MQLQKEWMFKREDKLLSAFLLLFLVLKPLVNAAFLCILILKSFHKSTKLASHPVLWMLIFYWLTMLISVTVAENHTACLIELATWLVFIFVAIYSSNHESILLDGDQYRFLIYGGLLLASFEIIISLMPQSVEWIQRMYFIQIPSINYTATILMVIFALAEYRRQIGKTKGRVAIIQEGWLLFALFCTDARGCLLLTAGYIVYLFIFRYKLKLESAYLVALCCFVLLAAYVILSTEMGHRLIKSLSSVWDTNNYSNNIRSVMYAELSEKTFTDHFWLGVGCRNFVERYSYFKSINFTAAHAHSVFLQAFVETGIIGLVALVAFTLSIPLSLLYAMQAHAERRLSLLLIEISVLFFAYSAIDNVWGDSRVGFLFFLLIGQAISFSIRKRGAPQQQLAFNA